MAQSGMGFYSGFQARATQRVRASKTLQSKDPWQDSERPIPVPVEAVGFAVLVADTVQG